ncbi:MAG: phosphoribosylformylglycinamidine synthase [Candidatus Gracilibacteria bacterium]|nr:phosphoribosylformylglycinamidine synthase [Candidatus Gracilibacteria bacterium]
MKNNVGQDSENFELSKIRELFVNKKDELDGLSDSLTNAITNYLGIKGVKAKIYNRYLIKGLSDKEFEYTVPTIFAELPVDNISTKEQFTDSVVGNDDVGMSLKIKLKNGESQSKKWLMHDLFGDVELEKFLDRKGGEQIEGSFYNIGKDKNILNIEALPGQYDARVDAIGQLLMVQTGRNDHDVRFQNTIVIEGDILAEDMDKIRKWIINPVEKHDSKLGDYKERIIPTEAEERVIEGFTSMSPDELKQLIKEEKFAMNLDDILFVQEYFKNDESRDPTYTELIVIDTYWSDHCRHTTFNTIIENVEFEGTNGLIDSIKETERNYKHIKESLGRGDKPNTLMEIATLPAKYLKANPDLNPAIKDIDESEEINACSFEVDIAMENGSIERWKIMYKNETHNHPTEIEPFGGSATCLGGCIRDPLSGRSWVFGGIRLSGSADPTEPISDTISGKLSQLLISRLSASGFSSYGNQIGIHTGAVKEYFHPGYRAKHFEVGYVIAGVPADQVRRERPVAGDIVIMLGGKTGTDGVGGAKGSSVSHDESSVTECGAEVQKGNPVTERAISILFRNPKFSRFIKRCNDGGAGGISVMVGELARGLDINLDDISVKYPIGPTIRAISESQERMSIVIDRKDYDEVMEMIAEANLLAVKIADVTDSATDQDEDRLTMNYRGRNILNISRKFLDTEGAKRKTNVKVKADEKLNFFETIHDEKLDSLIKERKFAEAFLYNLSRKDVASQKGVGSIFDNSVGATTVLAPFGGKNQLTPQSGMVSKIPTFNGVDSVTTTIATFGFNPNLASHSPFLGAMYAIIESVSKCIATGGDLNMIFLSLQEYFGKLGDDAVRWGEAYQGLLGAFKAQVELFYIALGGKDSMSGTYIDKDGNRLDVPPGVVSFATGIGNINKTISSEFKEGGNSVIYFNVPRKENGVPDFQKYAENLEKINRLIKLGVVRSSSVVDAGGIAAAISKMCFGNDIGFEFEENENIFNEGMGGIILEIDENKFSEEYREEYLELFWHHDIRIGETTNEPVIRVGDEEINLSDAKISWDGTLESVYSTSQGGGKTGMIETSVKAETSSILLDQFGKPLNSNVEASNIILTPPTVLIPVFPGTNSELDTAHMAIKAGFSPVPFYFRTQTSKDLLESTQEFIRLLETAQMVVFPGGFSAGDEPDGSGKYTSAVFRMKALKDAMNAFLGKPDTLTLGICNGFQTLIKLGVFDNGQITDHLMEDDFTLTFNQQHRHITDNVGLIVNSVMSPMMSLSKIGEQYVIPVSHGEGRLYIDPRHKDKLDRYIENGQVVMQYVDKFGRPTSEFNGSLDGIAAICSPDGRILGLMPHPERSSDKLFQNIPGNHNLPLFMSAGYAMGIKPKI